MEAKYYASCLWPGLPELWWRGQLSALPSAIAFAGAVNLILITRYLYPEWMSSGLVSMAFWVGLVTWVIYVARGVRDLPQLIAPRQVSDAPDRFPEAQKAFLAGRWDEAEALLTEVLSIEPRDPPALLLLTAVYRHTDRLSASRTLLEEIRKLEVAEGWWLEVAAEARRLQRACEAAEAAESAESQKGPEESEKNRDESADLAEESRRAA